MKQLSILGLAAPNGFFIIIFYLLKSSLIGFSFVTKYLMNLCFLRSLFIWLLINVCKVLSDHLLMTIIIDNHIKVKRI